MTLPQFLVVLISVIMAGGATVWASLSAGVPLAVLMILAMALAGLVHLGGRDHGR